MVWSGCVKGHAVSICCLQRQTSGVCVCVLMHVVLAFVHVNLRPSSLPMGTTTLTLTLAQPPS